MPSPDDVAAAQARRLAYPSFIRWYSKENGFPPTRRVLGEHYGISHATVSADLNWLRDHGFVTWLHNQQRTLRALK